MTQAAAELAPRPPRPSAPTEEPSPVTDEDAAQRVHEERRSAGLDGLRGLAALSVFFFHIYLYGRHGRAKFWWEAIPTRLSIGLLAFFVLSGFLLYRSFERAARRQRAPLNLRLYAKRRAARILPAYYVSLVVVYPVLASIAPARGVRLPPVGDLWLFALMGQNYSSATIVTLNPVTWTLAVELAFYAFLPLLGWFAFRVARGRRKPQVAMALGLVAFGVGWRVLGVLVYGLHLPQLFSKALPGYLTYFALGILGALLVAHWAEKGRRPLSVTQTAALMLAGVALVIADSVWHAIGIGPVQRVLLVTIQDLPAGIGFALITVAVASGAGRWASWASVRPVAMLGVISYGVYLWHVPVIVYLQHLGVRGFVALTITALPATLALAAASWHLVEKPLIARAHRRRLTPPAGPPVPVAAARG